MLKLLSVSLVALSVYGSTVACADDYWAYRRGYYEAEREAANRRAAARREARRENRIADKVAERIQEQPENRPNDQCREPIEGVDIKLGKERATRGAQLNWMRNVEMRYGTEWAVFDHADKLEERCFPATPDSIWTKKCRVVARPCRS